MDMQERIAARRAEMERQRQAGTPLESDVGKAASKQREDAASLKEQARQAAAAEVVLEGLMAEATAAGVKVRREGDRLILDEPPAAPPKIDRAGMKAAKVKQLLNNTARRRWTPDENMIVIGLVAAAIPMLGLSVILSAIMFLIGFWQHSVVMEKHRRELITEYPDLFGPSSNAKL